MVCHFVDDRVMPGTLMYECCLHALRIFMMRLGWIGSRGRVAFEPVLGIANRLRCRGQIVETIARGRLRNHDQGTRLPAGTLRDRRRPDPGRRQADRRGHRHGASTFGNNQHELERLWAAGARPITRSGSARDGHGAIRHAGEPPAAARSSTTTGFSHSRSANRRSPSANRYRRFRSTGDSSPVCRDRPTSSSTGSRGSTRNPG